MTRQTRAEARHELYEILAASLGVDVYEWLPTSRTGAYVVIENPGMRTEPTEWVWPVRVYAQASVPTMEEAQQTFDVLVDQVEELLRHYVVEQAPDAYSAEQDLYMAEFLVSVPRQDF